MNGTEEEKARKKEKKQYFDFKLNGIR